MRVSEVALGAIASATVAGNILRLSGQLDRKDYLDVAKVIEAMGGKWNRKAAAHLFDEDVEDAIQDVLNTGEVRRVKQDLGQFDTPPALAAEVVKLADLTPETHVLEPSAGIGNLVAEIAKTTAWCNAIELDGKRYDALCRRAMGENVHVLHSNFLTAVSPSAIFDRVVMNPPFAKQADVDHVLHALKFLKPGGRLVAIMSAGARFRENRKADGFRKHVAALGAEWRDVPEGAFKESGTLVRSCILIVNMPAA